MKKVENQISSTPIVLGAMSGLFFGALAGPFGALFGSLGGAIGGLFFDKHEQSAVARKGAVKKKSNQNVLPQH